MNRWIINTVVLLAAIACQFKNGEDGQSIDEDRLGIIDADVRSEDTHFKHKAVYEAGKPGEGQLLERAFENAPPMIPHTTKGFFPIKVDNNICLSCHLPEKAEEVGAVALPKTHFMNLRPVMQEKDGVLYFADEETVTKEELDHFNAAYFNCSQCHTPQANVRVDIENLFTPEFRNEFGLEASDLNKRIDEGV